MNLLLDLIPLQYRGGIGGAPSFTKRVCDEIVRQRRPDTQLFALYSSSMPEGCQYNCQDYARSNGLALIDIDGHSLSDVTRKFGIDVLFLPMAQFLPQAGVPIGDVDCKTVMFIHDIADMESNDNGIDLLLLPHCPGSAWWRFRRYFCLFTGRLKKGAQRQYADIMQLYTAPNCVPYTVSRYTSTALQYYFPALKDRPPRVCYSPLKDSEFDKQDSCSTTFPQASPIRDAERGMPGDLQRDGSPADPALRELIASGDPYLLFLAADREYKNVHLLLKVFPRLQRDYPRLRLLTLKLGRTISPAHTDIAFLNDDDLDQAYRHAAALVFPSFFEGFGYPPVEAMRHGIPSVVANVTSIPEVVGDAAEYFSPLYPADLYRALRRVLDQPGLYRDAMARRLQELEEQQQCQLQALVDEIYAV